MLSKALCAEYDLEAVRIHTHIGSGSDPDVWLKVALMNFQLVEQFKSVTILNLGGGYKVGRMPDEVSTDLQVIESQYVKPLKHLLKNRAQDSL